jgi:hypothetical protein
MIGGASATSSPTAFDRRVPVRRMGRLSSRVSHVVLDTNILVAALRSRRGASHRLLRLVDVV